MSDEPRVESFIDEEESDLINSLFLDGVDSSDSILNSQKREGGEKELSGGGEKDAGQSQNVKDPFEGMDDKEDAFEGVSDVGATEEKTAVNEKEVVASEEKEVKVVENEEKKNEEVVIEEKKEEKKEEEKEEKDEEKEEKEEEKEAEKNEEKEEEKEEKDEQNAITTNEKEENTTNNEEQEQNNTKPTKPTRRSPRIQNRKPSPREETTEDAQPENTSVPIDIVEDSVVINPLSSLRVQQDIHISEPRKMTLRERTKKSPTTQRTKKSPTTQRTKKSPTTQRTKKSPTRRTKRTNTEMLSQPPAVEEAVRKRRRRDTDCETQRSEVGLEERVRHSRNERRSEANARLIELGILRTTTSSDVWRARWQ